MDWGLLRLGGSLRLSSLLGGGRGSGSRSNGGVGHGDGDGGMKSLLRNEADEQRRASVSEKRTAWSLTSQRGRTREQARSGLRRSPADTRGPFFLCFLAAFSPRLLAIRPRYVRDSPAVSEARFFRAFSYRFRFGWPFLRRVVIVHSRRCRVKNSRQSEKN